MKAFWNFFASVKLAIVTLCVIAITSIFGTIIPQGNSYEWYVNFFTHLSFNGKEFGGAAGQKLALIIKMLDIDTMYSSWWFIALLTVLSINLVVCSLKRIPYVLQIIKKDNLSISLNRLNAMQHKWQMTVSAGSIEKAAKIACSSLQQCGWHPSTRKEDSVLFFSQKAPWSRMGVYVVHLSILVIFAGAFIGDFFGYKANILLPEGRTTSQVFSSEGQEPIDLGFSIRCDFFELNYYPNGMPKEYKSGLTILEDGKKIRSTEIEVNSPLKYRGITFYQSSYEAFQDFIITVTAKNSNTTKTFFTPFQQQVSWEDKQLDFGVINAEVSNSRLMRLKLWVSDNKNAPVSFWIEPNVKKDLSLGNNNYEISTRQMFATGLQVAKDPGVWFVYLGFALMLIGLYVSFFLSHRRVWVFIDEHDGETQVCVYGASNKNVSGFVRDFNRITETIGNNLA